jgi:N-acetylneuraminate synthase
MGAEMVEFHITLDHTMYGSDQAASYNPDGVRKVVKYIRGVEKALGDGKKKIYDSELPVMLKLRGYG